MNPLVDASLIQIRAKLAEKVLAQFFSPTVNNIVNIQVPPELLLQAGAAEAKALPPLDLQTDAVASTPASEPQGLTLVMPSRSGLGVIKAWEFNGTRVHVEFALLNHTEQVVAIRDVILLVGPGSVPDSVQFKQFVDVTPGARVPSERYRLPVVVTARSGIWLCAELEGPIDVNFGMVDRECSLLVALESGNVTHRFTAQGNPIYEAVLDQIQTIATEQKGAAAFALPISPLHARVHGV